MTILRSDSMGRLVQCRDGTLAWWDHDGRWTVLGGEAQPRDPSPKPCCSSRSITPGVKSDAEAERGRYACSTPPRPTHPVTGELFGGG